MIATTLLSSLLLFGHSTHAAGWWGPSNRAAPNRESTPIDIETMDVEPDSSPSVPSWTPVSHYQSYYPSLIEEGWNEVYPDPQTGYEDFLLDPSKYGPEAYRERRRRRYIAMARDPVNRRYYQKEQQNEDALHEALKNISTECERRDQGGIYSTSRREIIFHPNRAGHEVKYAYLQNGLPVLHKDAQGNIRLYYPRDAEYPDLANWVNDENSPADPGYEHIEHRPTGPELSRFDQEENAREQESLHRFSRME